ncbi:MULTISPECIES: glycoside hydrolase family 125 protein [unclassified Lentimonas]|uniref:glycoside hydrolase family 125 protein n=1 Tax=unclassified Lentimonas TaxID=2630993 RepID=UPI001323FF84|nr:MULTISPECIES: glycoside hydrolase family 125 protein [unclassified Lentimonas]CAA6689452.1 FIG01093382: hypothetical protein [Lentimonas sp. CC10]CAA6696433.1 FIG01093382: hypothetical protein [Lentimonas sp. CC19]CAA7070516.1 FIG01093382: hypothetical protein [Lentimonas sp. CC11]
MTSFNSLRPAPDQRTFSCAFVDQTVQRVQSDITDPELAWLFGNCFPNTLDTTVDYTHTEGRDDTFVITGDIDAMWLRDSTAQVWPYMPFIQNDTKTCAMVKGLVNRQAQCVLKSPYANAFYKDQQKPSKWASDSPSPVNGVHECKWEIDSLCYVVRLAYEYLDLTGDTTVLDDDWDRAMRLLVATLRTEQRKDGTTPYRFLRSSDRMTDAPVFEGTGNPLRPVGLIASMFRPSDDATILPFLIPSNVFAALSLRQLASIYRYDLEDNDFANECAVFATEIEAAVTQYGIVDHLHFGKIYAYEVDGYGNRLFMDDANVPSLMSLAYLDPDLRKDPIYQNTRRFLLSENNPYFLRGSAAEGQGSPHTGKENIWPMGIILRALTSQDDNEILHCLAMLRSTHDHTGFMHESFHKDDPSIFTRKWFAWTNTLFGELIMQLHAERPHLLQTSF